MAAYGLLDRLLHRLALGSAPIANLSFDLEQRLISPDVDLIAGERHVFVSGLARAGTTVLMRSFHESGVFRSLTYRDMPFVLAPALWRRLSRVSARQDTAVERAHGDNVMVDADSPESFDEVFWRVFAGADYIRQDCLTPHEPDEETIRKFVRYVGAIVTAPGGSTARYLSKNNNNILRLRHIRQAFPNALILVPFRDPLEQARSLRDQHRRFSRLQEEDDFALSYMNWLAHHEFGLGYRPFRFDDSGSGQAPREDPDSVDHWLAAWCDAYAWLDRTAPPGTVFVSYEELCADPGVWPGLAELAAIPAAPNAAPAFRSGNKGRSAAADPALVERAAVIYDRLQKRARASLGTIGTGAVSAEAPASAIARHG